MKKLSIICLIYKSVGWLDFLYKQLLKHTEITPDIEFFFVANDANGAVKQHLRHNMIQHYVHENTPQQRTDFYLSNVYRAYNVAVSQAKGEYVLLLNSDMAFTPGWLPKLMAAIKEDTCVCARLVESGRFPSGKYGVTGAFGKHYSQYNEAGFLKFAKDLEIPEVHDGGLYGPLLIKKTHFEMVGGYPEGNVESSSDVWNPVIPKKWSATAIPGDVALMKKLSDRGIKHQTCFDSIVYHFQSGESSSN